MSIDTPIQEVVTCKHCATQYSIPGVYGDGTASDTYEAMRQAGWVFVGDRWLCSFHVERRRQMMKLLAIIDGMRQEVVDLDWHRASESLDEFARELRSIRS